MTFSVEASLSQPAGDASQGNFTTSWTLSHTEHHKENRGRGWEVHLLVHTTRRAVRMSALGMKGWPGLSASRVALSLGLLPLSHSPTQTGLSHLLRRGGLPRSRCVCSPAGTDGPLWSNLWMMVSRSQELLLLYPVDVRSSGEGKALSIFNYI